MSRISIDRSVVEQALEALENCNSEHGHRCNRCDSEVDEGGRVVAALRAALTEEVLQQMADNARDIGLSYAPVQEHPMSQLRRVMCGVGIVGQIDGHDVIRRESVIELIDRAIAEATGQEGKV